LTPGARIEFDLRGQAAHRIRVVETRRAEDFEFPRPAEELKAGEAVPDFTLTDQTGRPFSLASQRGRVVLVNFLYTRCPLPEVCPRLAASFASLQRRFPTEDLTLVSITLDPSYDTPDVLARYAAAMKARVDRWRFLTGDTSPVARRFGLVHWAEEGVIVHNSQTAVIDRQGRLAAMVEGSQYRLEQLADLVRQTLAHRPL
jgi:protein SCO1/2